VRRRPRARRVEPLHCVQFAGHVERGAHVVVPEGMCEPDERAGVPEEFDAALQFRYLARDVAGTVVPD